MDQTLLSHCALTSKYIRRACLDMTYHVGNQGAHIGGALSIAEILAVLYAGILRYKTDEPRWEERDRFILSKGHGALALYPALATAGFLLDDELKEYKKNGSRITGHPGLHPEIGLEFASGSLGQGLSQGVGVGLALKMKGNATSRVFVLMGDGECNEGSVWEAAAAAVHYQLNTLVSIIDCNGIQYDGYTKEILSMEDLSAKWKAFGWETIVVDGHDIVSLYDALCVRSDKPIAVIAKTTKGKGVSFMENNWRWHNSRLSKEQYEQACAEQERSNA